jgi:predicted dinucleotide-binding enzyme
VVAPADFAAHVDVVLVAVAWDGLEDALALVGADRDSLAGKTVIDCTSRDVRARLATSRWRPTGTASTCGTTFVYPEAG